MRKRYQKKRSCPVCHGNKTGDEIRWTNKELEQLARWERERQEWIGHMKKQDDRL